MIIERSPDLLVIGGGAGGLAAARAGARAGARVLLAQQGPVGGDCTFTGCVPSKSLIEAARRGATFGEAMAAARGAVETIAATETDDVLRGEGVEVVHGWATFRAPGVVDVDGTKIHAERVVVATGAQPAGPPISGLADVDHLTSDTLWDLDIAPRSVAVLGGGAIGCELGQALARLGAAVTVVEAEDRLLPDEDPDVSAVIGEAFAAEGITVRAGQAVERVEPLEAKGAARLVMADGSRVEADRLLVAVGRVATTEGLGLDAAGVDTTGAAIDTDDTLATTAPGVWAVGDVTGRMQFTHAADEMGRVAAANALDRRRHRSLRGHRSGRHRFRTDAIPWVVFTDPEVAQVGPTEGGAARRRGARVAELPMAEVDRAIAAGEARGFVKLVAGPRRLLRHVGGGRLIGATIVAGRAGEMIHEPALAVRTGMFTGRLVQTVHAYPTWSVAIPRRRPRPPRRR